MSIKKYRAELPGWWNVSSGIWDDVVFQIGSWGEGEPSISYNYGLYDPRTHELVPKESYKKELIEKKKVDAERLQKQIEELNKEIKELENNK